MRITVTGGAGFIGKHVVRELARRGHEVRVYDNLHRADWGGLPEVSECIPGDIRDATPLAASIKGAEAVIHLAAQSNVMGSQADHEYTYSTNVTGTWNVARACDAAGVRHLVFSSSREVYGDAASLPVDEDTPLTPKNLYGLTKVLGEYLVRAAATPSTVLRLANVFGPGDSGRVLPLWVDAARRDEPLVLYGGAQVLDFVPIDTVVQGMCQALARSSQALPINVGSGKATRLRDLASHVIATLGSRSRVITEPPRGPEVTAFVADVSRMSRLLGVAPPVDPLASLEDLA